MPMQILSWVRVSTLREFIIVTLDLKLESNSPDSQMFYKNEDAASESDEDTKLEGK